MGVGEAEGSSNRLTEKFREWLDTLNSLPPNLKFVDPAEAAMEIVPKLRAQGAEFVGFTISWRLSRKQQANELNRSSCSHINENQMMYVDIQLSEDQLIRHLSNVFIGRDR